MKKEKIHFEEERQKPRLPNEGQKRIKGGGAHKNKKGYDKKDKKWKREDAGAPPVFLAPRSS
jgi:hypothetical protein